MTCKRWRAGAGHDPALAAALDAASDALRRDHGVVLAVAVMGKYRATAIAWRDEQRVPSASFVAHQRLAASTRLDLWEQPRRFPA